MNEEAATSGVRDTTTADVGPDANQIPEHWGSGTKTEYNGEGSWETGSTSPHSADMERPMLQGQVRTLDGGVVGDEFAGDAINYQILLGKIDALLERLNLDA